MVVGGSNLSEFYTANELVTIPAEQVGTSVEYAMIRKIKTSLTRTSFTVDQNEDDPDLTLFLETYAPTSTVTPDTGEYEDGTKFNSSQESSQTLLQVIYGGKDISSGYRKVVLMVCKLAQDAGSFDQEAGKYTKPKVSGDVVNPQYDMQVPSGLFCTMLVSGATNVTIPAKIGYKEVWFTAV